LALAVTLLVSGLLVLGRSGFSPATRWLWVGLGVLVIACGLGWVVIDAGEGARVEVQQIAALAAKSLLPGVWLGFGMAYGRGGKKFFAGTRWVLFVAFALPLGTALVFREELIPGKVQEGSAKSMLVEPAMALNFVLLLVVLLAFIGLAKIFKASLGTTRWRVKFLVLGIGIFLMTNAYALVRDLVQGNFSLVMTSVEVAALLIACVFIVISYFRGGMAKFDLYPSHAVLFRASTLLLIGGSLLLVFVIVRVAERFTGAWHLETLELVVLVACVVLALLLCSDRARVGLQRFISRHFRRPQYDFRTVWSDFARRVSRVVEKTGLCKETCGLISEVFNVLSVTVWVTDKSKENLLLGASTSREGREGAGDTVYIPEASEILEGLGKIERSFNLDKIRGEWAEFLRRANPIQFEHGGNRICVPLRVGERLLGLVVLADRVNGVLYTEEEMDLLDCIGDQVGAGLLNLYLTEEVVQARELEAFQTISAFFVHDMKNAVSGLNLMLKNMPVHFDDPDFRKDLSRGIARTVEHVNSLTGRLGAVRGELEINPDESDLNGIIEDVLEGVGGSPGIEMVKNLQPLPAVTVDRGRMHSVVMNLLLNAIESMGDGGRVEVETDGGRGKAVLSIRDEGCGMSPEFLANSLFRPFRTSKKKGIGIGMFQSKMIVEAHGGSLQVESEPGEGTEVRVSLPLRKNRLSRA